MYLPKHTRSSPRVEFFGNPSVSSTSAPSSSSSQEGWVTFRRIGSHGVPTCMASPPTSSPPHTNRCDSSVMPASIIEVVSLSSSVSEGVWGSVGEGVWGSVDVGVWGSVGEGVWGSVGEGVWGSVGEGVWGEGVWGEGVWGSVGVGVGKCWCVG